MSQIKTAMLAAHSARKLATTPVELPEVGTAHVRELTALEYEKFIDLARDGGNVRAKLATFALCDENGDRLFTDTDADLLGELPSPLIQRVYDAAAKLNALTAQV